MKNLYLILFFLFVSLNLWGGNLPGAPTEEENDTAYLKTDQTTPQTVSNGIPKLNQSASSFNDPDQFVNKAYVDLAVSSLKLDEYFSATASDIGGIYYAMTSSPASESEVVSEDITTSTTTNIFNFSTISTEPHLDRLLAGNYDIHAHLKKTGLRTIRAYCELYTRTAAGVETLRGTSSLTTALTTEQVFYDLYINVPTEVALNLTDRFVVKWYAVSDVPAGTTTVTMVVGGNADPHLSIDISSKDLDMVFVPYKNAKDNLDMGDKTIKAASITTGDATVSHTASGGVETVSGVNGTNNNGMNYDFETIANLVQMFMDPDTGFIIKRHPADHFESVQHYNGSSYTNYTTNASTSRSAIFTILQDTDDYIYVGKSDNFEKIAIDLYTAGAGLTLVFEYSKGGGEWGTLTITLDGTSNFTADGSITFTAPADWAADTINSITMKYIRWHATAVTKAPVLYLCTPTDAYVFAVFANFSDPNPTFCIDFKGGMIGINNGSPNNSVSVTGDIYATTQIQSGTVVRGNYFACGVGTNSALANGGCIGGTGTTGGTTVIYGKYNVSGNGGPITLGDPAIGAGSFNGQPLLLEGLDDTNTVAIPNASNTLNFGGATVTMSKGMAGYIWSTVDSDWHQVIVFTPYTP